MLANSVSTKKKVEVLLMGERFSVRSDRDEKHIEHLSRIVNDQLDEIRRTSRTISTHHVALLAALNISDELSKSREALAQCEELLRLAKIEHQEMKVSLANKARITLQEVETALSYLPAEYRARDERNDWANESTDANSDAKDLVRG